MCFHIIAGEPIPFVGCASDGQAGPVDAPSGESPAITINPRQARKLAYYSSGGKEGVLGPRGWHCFGIYGSGGDGLYVRPEPTSGNAILSEFSVGLAGPVIAIRRRYIETSGRFDVAEVIARVFPAYRWVAKNIQDGWDLTDLKFGPYPKDSLKYRSDRVVEFRTP